MTMIPFARAGEDDAIPAVAFLRCGACGAAVCAVVVQEIVPVEYCCGGDDHGITAQYRQRKLLLKCGGCDRLLGEMPVKERTKEEFVTPGYRSELEPMNELPWTECA